MKKALCVLLTKGLGDGRFSMYYNLERQDGFVIRTEDISDDIVVGEIFMLLVFKSRNHGKTMRSWEIAEYCDKIGLSIDDLLERKRQAVAVSKKG